MRPVLLNQGQPQKRGNELSQEWMLYLRTKNYTSFVIHPWLLVTGVFFFCFKLKMQCLKTRTAIQDHLYIRMSTQGTAHPKIGLLNPQLVGKLHANLKWENILQCIPWQSWDRLPKQFSKTCDLFIYEDVCHVINDAKMR